MAGGPTSFSTLKVTLIREHPAEIREIDVNYRKLKPESLAETNLFLKPGDTMIVF